jgi:hypothetical protein
MKSLQVLLLSLSTLVGFSAVHAADSYNYLPPPSHGIRDIELLSNAGVGQDVMLAYIDGSSESYDDLTAEDITRLENDGVPDAVIVRMLDHGKSLNGDAIASVNSEPESTIPVSYDNTPDSVQTPDTVPPASDMDMSFFYSALSPHGTWHQDSSYGWVWQPNEVVTQPDWRPYAQGGHWDYTDQGWYFQSDYPWSWAAFHYGRWTRTPSLSWVWVPDTVWAPSWVSWRQTNDSYGWAPLPPEARFDAGIGFRFHGDHVKADFGFGLGREDFTFVRADRFLSHDIGREVLPRDSVTNIYNKSVTINNTYVYNDNRIINNGIPVNTVAVATRETIRPIHINDQVVASGQPIPHEVLRDGSIQTFRPAIAPRAKITPDVIAQRRQERVAAAAAKSAQRVETKAANTAAAHERLQLELAKRTEAAVQRKAQVQTRIETNRTIQAQKKQEAAVTQQQRVAQRTAAQQAAQDKVAELRKAAHDKAAANRATQQQRTEAQRQVVQTKVAEQKVQREQKAQQQVQDRAAQTAMTQQKLDAQRQANQVKAAEQKAQREQQAQVRAAATQQKSEAQRQVAQTRATEQAAARSAQAEKRAETQAQRTQHQQEVRVAQTAKQQEKANERENKKAN